MLKVNNNNLEKDVKELGLDSEVVDILRNNNINTVNDLWCLNRKRLKELGINDNSIKFIIIKLQLIGLDLNRKAYR